MNIKQHGLLGGGLRYREMGWGIMDLGVML